MPHQRRLPGPASTRGTLGVGYGIAFADSPTARVVLHKYTSAYSLQPWMCLSNHWIYECCGAIMTFRASARVCVYAFPIAMQTFDIRALNILPDLCVPIPVLCLGIQRFVRRCFSFVYLMAILVCYKFLISYLDWYRVGNKQRSIWLRWRSQTSLSPSTF